MTQIIELRYEDLLHGRRYVEQIMDREWMIHCMYHVMKKQLDDDGVPEIACLVKTDANLAPWVRRGHRDCQNASGQTLVGVLVRGAPPAARVAEDLWQFVPQ